MEDYLAFAQDLARQGGELIRDNFGQHIDVQQKADHTPVTEVDIAINKLIISAVEKTYPEHGVLGEELSHGTGEEDLQWLVDPLDGTQCFIDGLKQSTCVIGLTKAGKVLLAAVCDPFKDCVYSAIKDQGAFCNGERMHVSNQPLKGARVLGDTISQSYDAVFETAGAKLENAHGAAFTCMTVASGEADALLKSSIDYHDVGPSSLIVQEAGGKFTDLNGSEVLFDGSYSGPVVVSNGVCHEAILALEHSA